MNNKESSKIKKRIIDELSQRINFCINDCNTYLLIKILPQGKKYADLGFVGGGNFAVLLASIVCIDLLSYVNFVLKAKQEDLWSQEEISKLELEKKKLSGNIKKMIRIPKANEPKNTIKDRFMSFLTDTSDAHKMNKDKIEKLADLRNKLAHVFSPKFIPAAGINFIGEGDFISLLNAYKCRPVFALSTNNKLAIDSNALNLKLEDLLNYLIRKIQSAPSQKLDIVNNWLKNN